MTSNMHRAFTTIDYVDLHIVRFRDYCALRSKFLLPADSSYDVFRVKQRRYYNSSENALSSASLFCIHNVG